MAIETHFKHISFTTNPFVNFFGVAFLDILLNLSSATLSPRNKRLTGRINMAPMIMSTLRQKREGMEDNSLYTLYLLSSIFYKR